MVKSVDEFWAALEAERHDDSWRNPPMRYAPKVSPLKNKRKVRVVRLTQDSRDKLMFNAGRYASGARDVNAVNANADIQKFWKS